MTRTQIKHLLYKEWLKTRWFAAVSLLLGIILSTYACIDALSSFHSLGGAFFYSTLLSGNISLMGQLKYLPLGVALLIGLSQFMPEITNKRIRLTLHLPIGGTAAVYTMILYGVVLFCCALLPAVLITTITMAVCFPAEITIPVWQTLFPWLLGGMTSYFFVAMIAFEPIWKFRFCYMLVAYFILRFFYLGYGTGNAVTAYPILLVITLISSLSVIYTSHRFNKGEL
ncbi:MAG TPA: hypothetical protein DHU85_08020 [Porphyromonadaceae bacterium]|jgi:hypothetical protein|nr:hypothetical protein [Coprobacter sp.]CDA21913.1 uncharacterized protein BN496_01784 [Bacteroides sp. CAG:144]HCZ21453.1 hypothetical protein [Porphyromonadaceae bacterium]